MKRIPAILAGSLVLAMAVTACVPLDSLPASPSAAPNDSVGIQKADSSPAAVLPTIEPYSTKGMEQRIKAMSEKSEARQIRAGKHPVDDAVPGSEKILVADTFSGEHYASLPKVTDGNHMMVMILCQKKTTYIVGVYGEPDGAHVAGGNNECGPWGGSGIGFGWSPHLTPTYVRVVPDGDELLELTVFSYEPSESSGS